MLFQISNCITDNCPSFIVQCQHLTQLDTSMLCLKKRYKFFYPRLRIVTHDGNRKQAGQSQTWNCMFAPA